MASRVTTAVAVIALSLALVAPVQATVEDRRPPAEPGSATRVASDLRITLGRLLGEHAFLVMEAMRAASERRPDFDALNSGLTANTVALRDTLAHVYGNAAGKAFQPIWQQHVDALFDWSRAKAAGNTAAADAALATLQQYRTDFGKFLTTANPKISGDAESHALQLHLDQLTSFVGMDYAKSFATERAAYSHMFEFGDDLARAIIAQFPEHYPDGNVAFSPRASLRLDLGRLLGEHLVVAAEAMRAGLADRPDRAASAASLDANSKELSAAIGRIFGAEAGSAFDDLWGRHVTIYLAYIEAVREGDEAGRADALASLHSYHTALAEFLNAAIPALSVADLEALISHHVTALINQVDAAAAGDHERTVAVTREAYAQMFEVGDALGTAIANQFPDRFSDVKEIPPTDVMLHHESMGHAETAPWVAILIGLGFVTGGIGFVAFRRSLRRP